MLDFARWILLPENRAARAAAGAVVNCLSYRRARRNYNPLFLHGPPGSGKSHLVKTLAAEATRRIRDMIVATISALDDKTLRELRAGSRAGSSALEPLRQADLLVIEDLQHFDVRAALSLAELLDWRTVRGRQIVLTASSGPGRLTHLPIRLTSRLAAGLVVGLSTLAPASRVVYLQKRALQGNHDLDPAVVGWLAKNTAGSCRQLEGSLTRMEALARGLRRPPSLDQVVAHFQTDVEARRRTVDQIARSVGRYYHVRPRSLQSRRRSRDTLLARQVSMYLARQVTSLSLQQIGNYFGGRDHSTVLYACRKVEENLPRDVVLSGAIHQLLAEVA